jgi:hypothetical protein
VCVTASNVWVAYMDCPAAYAVYVYVLMYIVQVSPHPDIQ